MPRSVSSLNNGGNIVGLTGPTGPTGGVLKISSVQVTNSAWANLATSYVSIASGGYMVVTGTGFQSGCVTYVDNTLTTSTTFVSDTTLRVTLPGRPAGSTDTSFMLSVKNPDGRTAIKVNAVLYGVAPTWTGASSFSITSGVNFSQNLTATGSNSYSLDPSSTLPAGVSLSSGGILSGSATAPFTFTVIATNSTTLLSASREFTVTVSYYNYLVKLYGLSSGTAFTDSSTYAHTITNSDNQIAGNSTAKNNGNSIFIGNNTGASNLRVNISARNIHFTNNDWSLGFWFQAANNQLNHPVGFETSADQLIYGLGMNFVATTSSSSIQNNWWNSSNSALSSGTTVDLASGTWYFFTLNHLAGTTIITQNIYNSSLTNILVDNTVNWTTWTGSNAWNYTNNTIAKIRINFINASTTYGRIDSLYFTEGTSTPPIPTSEPF